MLVLKLSHVNKRGPWCICFEETYHRISRTWTCWGAAWAVAIWMSPRTISLNLNLVKYRLSMASILLSNRFEIITAMFCRKFQSDLATEKLDIGKCDIARFEFEVSFGANCNSLYRRRGVWHDDVIKWKHFCVTGHSWGESTGHLWIPLTRAGDSMFSCFLSAPDQTFEKTIETPVIWNAIALIMTSL